MRLRSLLAPTLCAALAVSSCDWFKSKPKKPKVTKPKKKPKLDKDHPVLEDVRYERIGKIFNLYKTTKKGNKIKLEMGPEVIKVTLRGTKKVKECSKKVTKKKDTKKKKCIEKKVKFAYRLFNNKFRLTSHGYRAELYEVSLGKNLLTGEHCFRTGFPFCTYKDQRTFFSLYKEALKQVGFDQHMKYWIKQNEKRSIVGPWKKGEL